MAKVTRSNDAAEKDRLRERKILRELPPMRAVEITATIVRQYFDQMLLGRASPLLAGTPQFPEVTLKAR